MTLGRDRAADANLRAGATRLEDVDRVPVLAANQFLMQIAVNAGQGDPSTSFSLLATFRRR